ncbi:MAG: ATP-binding protein, partial [Acidobacteriota bacterium]|nr:ATP-binding protein [Acidobacteriota bacterium]
MVQTLKNGDLVREALRGSYKLTVSDLAPRLDWGELSASEHFVQFYEADEFLLDSLAGYVGIGLAEGDACIVIATREHRDALDARLRDFGLDAEEARASGQYVPLDAAETLSRVMAGGSPSPELFKDVVGGLITSAAQGSRRVRAFGEMVALLWAEGNDAAMLRLELLWSELQKTQPFMLFCGYPLNDFKDEAHADGLAHVCAEHSRAIPAESYTTLASPEERLRAVIRLQQKARTLEAEIAERKQTEATLRALKDRLEAQLEERKCLLAREQAARAEAESANRLKDEFLANVSHELRTPLTAIIGWVHMLRHNALDAETAARGLETIERNAQSQAQLVEDILDVSRVITGKLRLDIGPVDAASVINAAIDSVQLAAGSKGIRLEVTLDPSARHISGDSSRLQQVVWNLLLNAIKFTPAGGRVEVRLKRAGHEAQISVSDTGAGVSPDFLPYIFDRFRQADGTSTRRHGGLGLGLAIVRHLVELHGGTVRAESEGEGRGATVTVSLPVLKADEARPAEAPAAEAPALTSLEGVKVLAVDDEADARKLLAEVLGRYGAEVMTASSLVEALGLLQTWRPHVLLSDIG